MNKSDFYYEENLERQLKALQQENELLKQALNEIKEYINKNDFGGYCDDLNHNVILQIIDKYMKEDKI